MLIITRLEHSRFQKFVSWVVFLNLDQNCIAAVVSILAIGHNGFPAVHSTCCIHCMFSHACNQYSGTQLYGHPLNTDTRLIRTPALYGHPLYTDTRFILTPPLYWHPLHTDTRFIRTPALYGHPLYTDTRLIQTPALYRHLLYMDTCLIQTPALYGHPLYTDTRLIRTPALYRQFRLSQHKAHIFSLKLTRFMRVLGKADGGHFSVSRITNSHILSKPLYGHWLSTHCLFSLSQLCDN